MKKSLKKEIKAAIKAANRQIWKRNWNGRALDWYGWMKSPVSSWADKGDRRHIRTAAKAAAKAFRKDCAGNFIHSGKERAAARENLMLVIAWTADDAICAWLEKVSSEDAANEEGNADV